MKTFTTALLFIVNLLYFSPLSTFAQSEVIDATNVERLKEMAEEFRQRHETQKAAAIAKAIEEGWIIREEYEDGGVIEIQGLNIHGIPIYYVTDNLNAAKTVSTYNVWPGGSAGLSLDGSGMIVGEWDSDGVLTTHQELSGRVTQKDSPSGTGNHSTHVAGTMIATGVQSNAHGMANQATLDAYEWTNDESEMSTAAAAGLLMSNHSYGIACGWTWYIAWWEWYGDSDVDPNEDYKFGYYTEDQSKAWDEIAYNAPYYQIVKSGGNHRGEGPTGQTEEQDGGSDGYDCLGPKGVAKNVLTVGAVEDIPSGYSQPSDVVMSSFSSWGPTDDGRIKPDIVANGIDLYSCSAGSNTSYLTYSGTSMAAPNVTGSLVLLQQHYKSLSGGSVIRAATLKGLAIHTADEAGSADGPDYKFGWGLLNTEKAADLISQVWVSQVNHTLKEVTLNDGGSYSMPISSDGTKPLRVTICWTDPPGTPVTPLILDPPDIMLVNDLDLRLTHNSVTYSPWKFDSPDPNSPSETATTGDNIRDNVEQVYIASPPAGDYTITVNHKGSLLSGAQNFSLLMSGSYYSDQSLPVELSSFSATAGNSLVILNWETQSEIDNMGFNILRSVEKENGYKEIASFKDFESLKGLGSSSHGKEYKFIDFDLSNGITYWYKIQDVAINGKREDHGPIPVTPDASSSLTKESLSAPKKFALSQNYPNPFNPSTKFRVDIPALKENSINIKVIVYDILGKRIKTIYHGEIKPGSHYMKWNGTNDLGVKAPSGMYIYSVSSKKFNQVKKMILMK